MADFSGAAERARRVLEQFGDHAECPACRQYNNYEMKCLAEDVLALAAALDRLTEDGEKERRYLHAYQERAHAAERDVEALRQQIAEQESALKFAKDGHREMAVMLTSTDTARKQAEAEVVALREALRDEAAHLSSDVVTRRGDHAAAMFEASKRLADLASGEHT